MFDIDDEFRRFNETHQEEVKELILKEDPNWANVFADYTYHDYVHEKLIDLFEAKIKERVELLLQRPEERRDLLKGLIERLRGELEDYYVEQYASEAVETLVLLRMLEPEAAAWERFCQPKEKYVYNKSTRNGKVHIFRGHWRRYIDNPSYPAPCDHYDHKIFFGCEQTGFRFATAPYKPRDVSGDYVITTSIPEGREFCKSCVKARNEENLKSWGELADWAKLANWEMVK